MFTKLYEMGYSPIPVYFKGKNPCINEWSKYCESRPDESLIEKWQSEFENNKINVGVTCGKASGIIVLDIDTDDKDFLTMIPLSPVRRRGSKGEARFFRYTQEIKSSSFPFLDILSDGRQILVPPSIHPNGEKYVWLTDDTLENTKPSELPELDLSALNKFLPTVKQTKIIQTGRNNKLVDIVSSMRGRGEGEEKIIKEIYDFDAFHNNPRLFTDRTEGFTATNEDEARKNAWLFVSRVTTSLIQKGIAKPTEQDGKILIEINDKEIEEAKDSAFKFQPYPKPRGMMKLFQEICELKSAGRQDATGLGGSISLMSAITSNRFVTECRGLITCPNTYVINLGYSSFGKEMAQSLINDLLQDSNLLGSGNYKSAASIIMNLPKQQERLDVIDECSTILSAMGSKEGYAAQIVELLSELFTKGATKYNGQSSLTNGERFGACYNPHISLIGSTTPKGFRSSVNKEVAAKGLLPRMLLFFQHEVGDYKGRQDKSKVKEMEKDLRSLVDHVLKLEKKIHPDFNPETNLVAKNKGPNNEDLTFGYRYAQTVIPMTEEAHLFWLEYEEDCHNKKKLDPEGFESAFIGRFAELTAKLALLDTISLGRSKIEIDSLLWAKEVVEVQWHNAKPLYEVAHAENKTESDVLRVLSIIKKIGIISRSDLVRKTQWLEKRLLEQTISTLIETGQIESVQESGKQGSGRRKTYYKIMK